MIFLLPFLFAEEPKYTNLKEGEIAPWAGRLLNEAALRILVEENATYRGARALIKRIAYRTPNTVSSFP